MLSIAVIIFLILFQFKRLLRPVYATHDISLHDISFQSYLYLKVVHLQ